MIGILHFIESKHTFQKISKKIILFFRKKSHFWRFSVYHSKHKKMLSRYTATFISDDNSRLLFSEVQKLTKLLPLLTAWYFILCTRRLQPPHDNSAVRVQWFSSAM